MNSEITTAGLEIAIEATRGPLKVEVSLSAIPGETIAIVGPNGSGKSTLLHCLAGLIAISKGRVSLGSRILEDSERRIAIHERRCALLFQEHQLFPHLNVLDNVAFALATTTSKRAARRQASTWLEKLDLSHLTASLPEELSGGQTQRVALARALASEPELLLLDEPLSALDLQASQDIRRLLNSSLHDFAGITLLVTHDPIDALALADRILVLEAGVVTQLGSPDELREHPATPYVAEFVGLNRLLGSAHGDHVRIETGAELTIADEVTGPVAVLIHPRAIAVHTDRPQGSPRNVLPGTITHLEQQLHRTRVSIDGALPVVAELTPKAINSLGLSVGSQIWVAVKATEIVVQPQ